MVQSNVGGLHTMVLEHLLPVSLLPWSLVSFMDVPNQLMETVNAGVEMSMVRLVICQMKPSIL